jgi:hypothetical protein
MGFEFPRDAVASAETVAARNRKVRIVREVSQPKQGSDQVSPESGETDENQ